MQHNSLKEKSQISERGYFYLLTSPIVFLVILTVLGSCNGSERDRKGYRIARDTTWYPVELMGKERNLFAFATELLSAISKEEGIHLDQLTGTSNGLIDGLESGRYDGILSSMVPNVVSEERYFFSDPFYLLGPVLVVRMDSGVHSLSDMDNRIVGIRTGSSMVFNIAQYPSILVTPYDSLRKALDDLTDDKIDGVILPAVSAYVYTQGFYAGKLKVATSPLTKEGLRLVTRRDPELLRLIEKFNQGLSQMKQDGRYESLLLKWGLSNPEI